MNVYTHAVYSKHFFLILYTFIINLYPVLIPLPVYRTPEQFAPYII